MILPKFQKECRNKRGIFRAIISGFLGLALEGILNFVHHKRHKALQKAVKAMSITMEAQRNKFMHLENSLIIYRVYDVETLEKLVETVQVLHSLQSLWYGINYKYEGMLAHSFDRFYVIAQFVLPTLYDLK